MLVVPIRDAFLDAFAMAQPDLPKEARFVATMQVMERGRKRRGFAITVTKQMEVHP